MPQTLDHFIVKKREVNGKLPYQMISFFYLRLYITESSSSVGQLPALVQASVQSRKSKQKGCSGFGSMC